MLAWALGRFLSFLDIVVASGMEAGVVVEKVLGKVLGKVLETSWDSGKVLGPCCFVKARKRLRPTSIFM